MRFVETDPETIFGANNKTRNKEMKNNLSYFISTGYKYAEVIDNENHYNNNNDLRRAIQDCINRNNLPIRVFMWRGKTYIERIR